MVLRDYSIKEICELSSYKKLYYFGAGKALNEFLNTFRDVICLKSVKYIIDNDKEKQGNKIRIQNRDYIIRAVDAIENDALVIITSASGYDIYGQLVKNKVKGECCYYKFIYAREEEIRENSRIYPDNFRRSNEQKIPKIIHYCWFGGQTIPHVYEEWMSSWKKFCADYEIVRWDENNYDYSWSKYMTEAYEHGKWAFVSDVARLDIIYKNGGIYLDTDVELIKPLDELLYQDCYFGVESGGWVATGLGFGAVKNHYLIAELLKLYNDYNFVEPDGNLNLTSCPVLQKKCFEEAGYPFTGDTYLGKDFSVYPERVFSPKSTYDRKIHIEKSTFSIHHYDCSWSNIVANNSREDEKLKACIKYD